jgi:glycosyltransferase involved in cell wall biosynthesis
MWRQQRSKTNARRVLMITEGTYPYAVGGVSSWCDAVIDGLQEIEWEVLPIVAGGKRLRQDYTLPANAHLRHPIELWSDDSPPRRGVLPASRKRSRSVPARLLHGLLTWNGDPRGLTEALVQCRKRPQGIRPGFRSRRGWEEYLRTLADVLGEQHDHATRAPIYDALDAARLYQTLYWVARAAAVPTPRCAIVHATAAGWSAIPAIVHKALFGTPLLVTEHGIFLREAYLGSLRDATASPTQRHMTTRLALGLTRAAYAAADMVAPVTEANAAWERGLGVDPARIRVIANGIPPQHGPTPPPRINKVVAIGRIDPLKDVQTMLLVAAEVCHRLPGTRFEYWGPPTSGQEVYAEACKRMREQLGLGASFRFMGRTSDPQGVIRGADVVLMTSISEGMPMTLLEAMSQARPAVATGVGGIPGVLRGCGIVAPPGDIHGLAAAIVTLLRDPELAAKLGQRAYARLNRHYTLEHCVEGYRTLIEQLIGDVTG